MHILKGMFMTCGAPVPSNQLAGWGATRHHCSAGHESRINPNNLCQVPGSILLFQSLLLVWFAGDMKSEHPSKDDEQDCCCVVWEGKLFCSHYTLLSPHQAGKALSFASFIPAKADVDWLCFIKEILALAERESSRFSPLQSESYYL